MKNQAGIAYHLALTDGFLDSRFRGNDKKEKEMLYLGIQLFKLYLSFPCFYSVIPAKAGIQERKLLLQVSSAIALVSKVSGTT
ncbi:MAG: hypothetical protein H7843_09325 [Nitrospirota bacterium]